MSTLNNRLQLALLNRKKCRNALEKGFTLVELMIVIVIVGVLSAVALPNFLGQTKKAKATECKTQLSALLKQVATVHLVTGDSQQAVGAIVGLTAAPYAKARTTAAAGTNPIDVISNASNSGLFNYVVTFPAASTEAVVTMTCQAWHATDLPPAAAYPSAKVDNSLEADGMFGCVNLSTGKTEISADLVPSGSTLATSGLPDPTTPCGVAAGSITAPAALS